ncbi:MAG: phage major capsid protein [Ruminococcaceae bacterium]|nr:phage major capsid protein [Oscillospiraceae bacterium]
MAGRLQHIEQQLCFSTRLKGDYTEGLTRENLFRRHATILDTPDSDGYIQTMLATANAEVVDDCAAYPEDSDTFATITFKAHKIASLSKLPINFINDTKFDVYGYLKNEYARRFGRCEERLFLTGSGYDEPKGIIHSAEVGTTTSSITYDDVVKLFFSLKPEYRKKAVWIVNDETALKLRALKNESGDYIWNQHDNTILGRPVEYSEFMPSEAAGAKPIVFGDLSYYYVVQRNPLSVRPLVEMFAEQGMVGFAGHERVDGKLIRAEAAKTLEITG